MTPVANRFPRRLRVTLAVGPLAVLALFYAWPFATVLARALAPSAFGDTLGRGLTWRVLWFTTWQAVVSTIITVTLGLFPAHVVARYDFAGRRVLDGLLAAVFVLPTVVMGAAVLALLPRPFERGVVAIVVAHVLFNLAVVVRTVGAALAAVPLDAEAAAATLGASPTQAWRHVTLPRLWPSVLAAASVVFVFTFTSFGVVRVLGGGGRATIEVEIWRQATQFGNIGAAAVLTAAQLLVVGLVVAALARGQRRSVVVLDPRRRTSRRRATTPGQRLLVATVGVVTVLLAGGPLVALVERSLRTSSGYSLTAWTHLGDVELRPGISIGIDAVASLRASLQAMVIAVVLAVVVGAMAAVAISMAGSWSTFIDTTVALPIATSAVTVGLGLLITFDTRPFDWRASWWLLPVGHALVALPFVVRTVLPAIRSVDPRRIEAAATLGASPVRAWLTGVGPVLRRPVTAAAGLAGAISLGEFGATSLLSRSGRETMPVAIERLLGRSGTAVQAQGYVLAVILAAATVAVVMAVEIGLDRK